MEQFESFEEKKKRTDLRALLSYNKGKVNKGGIRILVGQPKILGTLTRCDVTELASRSIGY